MITVGITTFKYRFEQYFKPLLNQIKSINPNVETVVAINGEHNQPLDEAYRSTILKFISEKPNVIPIMYPCFRGLSKLWNQILITASYDYVFLLNDDIGIADPSVFSRIISLLIQNEYRSFKINNCWSHAVLNKREVDEIGYFDERLLGIGEEDRDFEWRYGKHYNREFRNFEMSGLINYNDMSHHPVNIKIGLCNKYSLFNYRFIYDEKYRIDDRNGQQIGMWPEKLNPVLKNEKQYPYESFFQKRKVEM